MMQWDERERVAQALIDYCKKKGNYPYSYAFGMLWAKLTDEQVMYFLNIVQEHKNRNLLEIERLLSE